jgi:hypothetical protein
MRQDDMSDDARIKRRRGAVRLSEIIGTVIDPVTARRGFAKADLIAVWPALAGPLFADCTAPEKIVWPRDKDEGGPRSGVLVLRVDGPKAVLVQHELPQIVERINAFLGHAAVRQVRIVQGPVARRRPPAPSPGTDADGETGELTTTLATVTDDKLRAALDRLGRAVYRTRLKQT